jgi:hypothetical protein
MATTISSIPPNQMQAQNINAMDKVPQEKLYSPGAYSIPRELLEPIPRYEEKKGGFISTVAKLLITAGFGVGGAIAFRKFAMKDFVKLEGDNLTRLDKFKNKFVEYADKGYEYLLKGKDKVVDFVKGLKTSKASAPKPEPPTVEAELMPKD